ncbi:MULTISPECIES: hypothetical protein [Limnochorda]|uniref:hypothetical protein n=1 Tax=Limnochorda TaxID=1676651 RepID=UPI0026E999BE|nr:hypothetical protein [Limnochorda pilosa]
MGWFDWLLALMPLLAGLGAWYVQTSIVLIHEEGPAGPPRVTLEWITPVIAFHMTTFLVYGLLARWLGGPGMAGEALSRFRLLFLAMSAGLLGSQIVDEPRFPIPPAAPLPPFRRVVLQLAAGTPWWFLADPTPVGLAGLAALPRWLGLEAPPTRLEEFFGLCALFAGVEWTRRHLRRCRRRQRTPQPEKRSVT